MIIYPNLVYWYRAKLLGAGTESFRTDFVELRAPKACASSLPTLEHLPPALSYLDHPPLLCQRAFRMDEIIDHALLRAGAPARAPRPPDSSHQTYSPLPPH